MKTRVIHTKIWDDNWFLSLPRASRLLFIYLVSNSSIGLCDTYEIPDAKICYQTGLTNAELEQSKKDLNGKVSFLNGWVRINNIDRYQNYSGPKNEIAKEKEEKSIPPDVRDTISIPYRYPIDSTSNHKSEISNKKEGGLGETKSIETLTDEFCANVAKNYKVSIPFVLKKKNDLILYCRSTGKRYKDYQAALQQWVRKDRDDRKQY